MEVKNFRDLLVWKMGTDIAKEIYALSESFPTTELYGLTQQMRRSAVSIPSNIAEGFNRRHKKEFRRFLYISLGSCAELETQLELSHHFGFLTAERFVKLINQIQSEERMLNSLANKF